jgi:drug/metabolite transporter (DMT)-like permease
MGAIKANNYMYLQPVFTMVFSAIILSEKITIIGIIGFATILLGLWLGDYLSRKKANNQGR